MIAVLIEPIHVTSFRPLLPKFQVNMKDFVENILKRVKWLADFILHLQIILRIFNIMEKHCLHITKQ